MSGPASPSGSAQIPLPPGVSLEDYMSLQGQAGTSLCYDFSMLVDWIIIGSVTIAITVAVVTAIVIWD